MSEQHGKQIDEAGHELQVQTYQKMTKARLIEELLTVNNVYHQAAAMANRTLADLDVARAEIAKLRQQNANLTGQVMARDTVIGRLSVRNLTQEAELRQPPDTVNADDS